MIKLALFFTIIGLVAGYLFVGSFLSFRAKQSAAEESRADAPTPVMATNRELSSWQATKAVIPASEARPESSQRDSGQAGMTEDQDSGQAGTSVAGMTGGQAGVTTQSATPTPPSVTLSIRFQPFENYVGLTHTTFGNDPIPDPAEEPWNKEGFFVLKVEAIPPAGPLYSTWLTVDAIHFMIDPDTNPVYDLDVTLPYTPGMRVIFSEPSGHRTYLQSIIP